MSYGLKSFFSRICQFNSKLLSQKVKRSKKQVVHRKPGAIS